MLAQKEIEIGIQDRFANNAQKEIEIDIQDQFANKLIGLAPPSEAPECKWPDGGLPP